VPGLVGTPIIPELVGRIENGQVDFGFENIGTWNHQQWVLKFSNGQLNLRWNRMTLSFLCREELLGSYGDKFENSL
jgi:hypothetical protein